MELRSATIPGCTTPMPSSSSDIIRQTRPELGTLMYVGHNPAAQQLAAALTGQRQEFPTAAIAVIELAGGWTSAGPGAGKLAASWAPVAGS